MRDGNFDCSNQHILRPLVANFGRSAQKFPLVANLYNLAWKCPLVVNYGRMIGEHPLRENLGRLAEECPLVAIFGRTEREPI